MANILPDVVLFCLPEEFCSLEAWYLCINPFTLYKTYNTFDINKESESYNFFSIGESWRELAHQVNISLYCYAFLFQVTSYSLYLSLTDWLTDWLTDCLSVCLSPDPGFKLIQSHSYDLDFPQNLTFGAKFQVIFDIWKGLVNI